MKTHDFLLELGTEELPPKLLLKLSNSLKDNLSLEFEKLNIEWIDYSNNDEKVDFLDALNSYLFFKKDNTIFIKC